MCKTYVRHERSLAVVEASRGGKMSIKSCFRAIASRTWPRPPNLYLQVPICASQQRNGAGRQEPRECERRIVPISVQLHVSPELLEGASPTTRTVNVCSHLASDSAVAAGGVQVGHGMLLAVRLAPLGICSTTPARWGYTVCRSHIPCTVGGGGAAQEGRCTGQA